MKYAVEHNKKLDDVVAVNHYSNVRGINENIKELDSNYKKLRYLQNQLDAVHMQTFMQGMLSA